MGVPLRVLIVEDSPDDADLTVRSLMGGGYDPRFERVDTADAMGAALDRESWDVVISDYSMPRFSGPAALALLQRRGLDLPFIIVSGTVGDEVAVAAMKAGAHDFIVKGKLARLLPALEREMREVKIRAEQKRMREQLLISERMASAGTLAAGVAHEINNPLAVVAANLEFLTNSLAKLAPEARALALGAPLVEDGGWMPWLQSRIDEAEEPLHDAREAVARIRDIVRDVKLFSSTREDARGPVDVRAVCESSLRMAWNEIRHRAQLLKEYGDVPPVEANEGRLGQVVLNLLVNAAQAIPEGNAKSHKIRVTTRALSGDRVSIEVFDTGAGIPASNLERIFDPFFTTKPIGVGTGLGLAICHRIVTDLGGSMSVESELGRGTLFRVILPAAKAEAVPVPPSVRLHDRGERRARILLVDDEIALCRAVQRSLSRFHDVTVSNSGREAISRVVSGERYDVIVSDLMMPEVTGMEIHDELSRRVPDQANRMVFLTGGAFTAGAREFLDTVPNPRIEKPFDMTNLLTIVAGLL
jgi:signal transduction histidine kinase